MPAKQVYFCGQELLVLVGNLRSHISAIEILHLIVLHHNFFLVSQLFLRAQLFFLRSTFFSCAQLFFLSSIFFLALDFFFLELDFFSRAQLSFSSSIFFSRRALYAFWQLWWIFVVSFANLHVVIPGGELIHCCFLYGFNKNIAM